MAMLERHDRLHELTREYSRYSRSAGGLSAVLGGTLCLASYFAGGLLPMSPALQISLIAIPPVWLLLKQGMARRYYQRLGQVEEMVTAEERNLRLWITLGVALICLIVVAGFFSGASPLGLPAWDLRSVGFATLVAAAPIIGWYWLRTPLDLVVGVFLTCQAALAITGDRYSLWSSAVVFPVAALLLVAAGIRDHRRFLELRAEIRDLVNARQQAP